MNRRFLLLAPLALAACQTAKPSPIATDAALIAAGSAVVRATLDADPSIPAADRALIDRYDDALQAALVLTRTVTDATTSAQQIAVAVRGLEPLAVKYLPVGSREAAYVRAAVALVPVVLSAAGVVSGPARAREMGVGEARGVLRGAGR